MGELRVDNIAIASVGISAEEAVANICAWASTPEFVEYMRFWDMCMTLRETPPDENPSGGG